MDNALLTHLTAQRQKIKRVEAQNAHERRMNEQEPTMLTYRGVRYQPNHRSI